MNDTLVQICRCIDYASKFKRHLIIDTLRSGICDHFNNYFEAVIPFQNLSLSLEENFDFALKRHSCVPKSLLDREMSYKSEYLAEINNFVDTLTKEQTSFSFAADYDEDLLIHEQCGGGAGRPAFSYFRFKKSVREEINTRLRSLPKHYMAAHVRHSDVKTDYKLFFHAIKHIVEGKDLLLCTDSFEVLTYANTFLKNTNVINISDIPNTNGATLHDHPFTTDWNVNIGCLSDIIALGRASAIILPSKQVGYQSGYAQLGLSICQDYFLINQLMGNTK